MAQPDRRACLAQRPRLNVRSGGTSGSARHTVSQNDIEWAEVVIAMEHKHKSRLVADFGGLLDGKPVHVLDVPDEYRYMDPELVGLLERAVGDAFGACAG